jgi:hypothetical protein
MYYPRCPVSGTGTSKATRARPVFCGDARALSRISSRRLHCADVLNAAEKHSMFLSVLFGHRHSTCNACYNGRNTLRLERGNICFQGTILMDGASDCCVDRVVFPGVELRFPSWAIIQIWFLCRMAMHMSLLLKVEIQIMYRSC